MDDMLVKLLESVPDAMVVVARDGKIAMVNGQTETMFGYDRSELIGQAVELLIPDAFRARHRAYRTAYFDEPKTRSMGQEMELVGKNRDGREFSVEISLGPIETESGLLALAAVRDVTDQRRAAAEALAAKDHAATAGEQLTNAIESISEGYVLYDSKGCLVHCNSAFREFYGYSEANTEPGVATYESLGLIDQKRDVTGRKRRSFPKFIADYRRTGTKLLTDIAGDRVIERRQVMTADGGLTSVQIDITDRVQADDALQEGNKLSSLLQRISIAANQATSVEGVLQFCLDEICATTGWPVGHVFMLAEDGSGDVISSGLWHMDDTRDFSTIQKVTHNKRLQPRKGLVARVLKSGYPAWIVDVTEDPNFERAHYGGNIAVKAGFAFPVLIGSQTVAVFEFYAREAIEPNSHLLDVMAQIGTQLGRVIERQKAETALRDSEERFRFVMDRSPAAVNLKDPEGRYLLVNARFEEWYGLAAENVIGKNVGDVFPQVKMAPIVALEREILSKNKSGEIEFHLDFADGTKHLVLASKFLVNDSQGNLMGVGTIETDITEQRQTETQLRQAQKMEAVGQLTGGVAHDFNNLLAVISGNLELLGEALEGESEKQELLSWAIKATDDAASLTQQLLAFSRRKPVNPSTLLINDLVNSLLTMLGGTLGEIVDVTTELDDSLWLARVDPAQFENAVLNLVLNARDAMPDGGAVTIATTNITLGKHRARDIPDLAVGDYVKLSVSDTGPGLSDEMIEHVFEPFYTTKEAGQGSGLGLSMVYGFCQQSGGYADIESIQGQGATVSIYLPRAEQDQVDKAATNDMTMPRGKGEVILVVEDEASVRDLALRLLLKLGYDVVAAIDAKAALKIIDSDQHIDLLFTDIVLPGGMSGLELVASALPKRPGLAVIYVSGYSAALEADDPIEPGAIRLAKPYRGKALAEALRRALGDGDFGY